MSFAMKRHALLILLRLLLATGIMYALPFAHMNWGEPYPGDGQQAFGMVAVFTLIGTGFASAYFAVGAFVQFLFRRKSWRWTVVTDAGIFLVLGGLLTYGGVTARYSEDGEPNGAANGSQPIRSETNPPSSAAGCR